LWKGNFKTVHGPWENELEQNLKKGAKAQRSPGGRGHIRGREVNSTGRWGSRRDKGGPIAVYWKGLNKKNDMTVLTKIKCRARDTNRNKNGEKKKKGDEEKTRRG